MLTVWLDGWFSSAFNIIELIKNNPDKKPIKVIASHHKDMGYKVLCDEFYLREDFPENDNDMNYKEWAIDFVKRHEIDIFFPRKYYGTLYNTHKDFVYVDRKSELKECKLVLPGLFFEPRSSFTTLFEDKLWTQNSLSDWDKNLRKYELPCDKITEIADIERFKKYLDSKEFSYNKLCIKPIKGTGAQGFRILDYPYDSWKIRDILERSGQEFIIMPYLEGNELSIDFLFTYDKNGKETVIFVPRIKNRVNRIQEIVLDEEVKTICEDIDKAGIPYSVEVIGNIQFMKHKGKYYLLEINPRMSGGIYLDALAGVNFPYLMIKKILGEEIKIPRVKKCKVVNVERGVKVQ